MLVAMIGMDVPPASAGDPLGQRPPAEAGATSACAKSTFRFE
jgi:hypothetical protein